MILSRVSGAIVACLPLVSSPVLPRSPAAQGRALAEQTVTIVALDGRNGQPVPNQSLLVIFGTPEQTHGQSTHVTTDGDGVARLTAVSPHTSVEIFPEWEALCYTNPNGRDFSLATIGAKGVSTPNNCGPHGAQEVPGRLTVFVRPEHWWEKMAH